MEKQVVIHIPKSGQSVKFMTTGSDGKPKLSEKDYKIRKTKRGFEMI